MKKGKNILKFESEDDIERYILEGLASFKTKYILKKEVTSAGVDGDRFENIYRRVFDSFKNEYTLDVNSIIAELLYLKFIFFNKKDLKSVVRINEILIDLLTSKEVKKSDDVVINILSITKKNEIGDGNDDGSQ